MGKESKIGTIYYDIEARVARLERDMKNADELVKRHSDSMQRRLENFKARIDDRVMKMKLGDLKKTAVKLQRELERKTKLGVDLASIKRTRIKIDTVNNAIREMESAGVQTSRGLKASIGSIITKLGGLFIVLQAVRKALQFAFSSKNLARDFKETDSKFKVVFRDLADEVRNWAKEFGTAVGRSQLDLEKWLSTLQDTFVPLGFTRKKSAELSKELTRLAVDVASFNNAVDDDVLRDFTSALVGNHETVRKYGILITEATIKQEAFNEGLDPKNLSELQKVMLRYNIILGSTKDAQGDAIRTADSLANREKKLNAVITDLKTNIGSGLTPVFSELVSLSISFLRNLTESDMDAALRRMKELGVDTKQVAEAMKIAQRIKLNEQLKDLQKIASGGGNGFTERIKRLKDAFNVSADQWEEFNRRLTTLYTGNKTLEQITKEYQSLKDAEGRLQMRLVQPNGSEKEKKSIEERIEFYQRLEAEYESVIKTRSKIAAVEAELKALDKSPEENKTGNKTETTGSGGGANSEITAAKNSAKELQTEIDNLKEKIDNTSADSPMFKVFISQLAELEAKLEEVKAKYNELHAAAIANANPVTGTENIKSKGLDAGNDEGDIPMEAPLVSGIDKATEKAGELSDVLNSGAWQFGQTLIGSIETAMKAGDEKNWKQIAINAIASILNFASGNIMGGVSGMFSAFAHDGGTFLNGQKIASFSGGTDGFTVPPGFPNDSYPIMVESGEQVKVTPSSQVGKTEKLLAQMIGRLDALNMNLLNKKTNIIVNNTMRPTRKSVELSSDKQFEMEREGVKFEI